jgi:hypothetical protein
MSKTINKLVDELPAKSWTVRLLQCLDWVVPGQWKNLVGFDNTIETITGEDDPKLIQKIGERAIVLYNDKSQGYQRAVWLYQTVDMGQGVAGAMALANIAGEKLQLLNFLGKITPKSQTTQTVDLAVKLIVELVGFCYVNGIPGDSISDFVRALGNYGQEASMRVAALVCIDGILPLGPEFLSMALKMIETNGASALAANEKFQLVKDAIPGNGASGQASFMTQGMGAVKDWLTDFVKNRSIDAGKVAGSLRGWVDWSADKLDLAAAVIDSTCNYYTHTGIQTVARRLIKRAAAEV